MPDTMNGVTVSHEWYGDAAGVRWSVRETERDETWKAHSGGNNGWGAYIVVHEATVPEPLRAGLFLPYEVRGWMPESKTKNVLFDYYKHLAGWVHDLPWHGGVTFYDCVYPDTPGHRVAKIGCDYGHLYDDEIRWRSDRVIQDIRAVCRAFREAVPGLLGPCRYCGGMFVCDELEKDARGFCAECGTAHPVPNA